MIQQCADRSAQRFGYLLGLGMRGSEATKRRMRGVASLATTLAAYECEACTSERQYYLPNLGSGEEEK